VRWRSAGHAECASFSGAAASSVLGASLLDTAKTRKSQLDQLLPVEDIRGFQRTQCRGVAFEKERADHQNARYDLWMAFF
jgi:hypothetical protein